ncbi:4-alpha-glucanotransferase [Myxococcaceae bacterium GXIMD 01537]
MYPLPDSHRTLVTQALEALGVRHLVLSLQDPSFPSEPGEDVGRGSPYSAGAARFLSFARELGFNGVQLGPQGQTTDYNPSPYDGTLFSRNILNVALRELAREARWGGLLAEERVEAWVAARPRDAGPGALYRYAFRVQSDALREAWNTFRVQREQGGGPAVDALERDFEDFRRANTGWLERDALFDVVAGLRWNMDWRRWLAPDTRLLSPAPGEEAASEARVRELRSLHADYFERYAFQQFLVHAQHRTFRALAAREGLRVYGDLQIGFSPRDAWACQGLFLRTHLMGAPPSRTNREGQPWGYPVLDPTCYLAPGGGPGPVLRFLEARLDKMLAEYDSLRLDHPHGLVDPWVYRAGEAEPLRAVRDGARLFSSPDLADHPELARYAIARPEDLDHEAGLARYADGWVRTLTPEQVGRYGILFDAIVSSARRHGRDAEDLLCEVLSTQPYPLRRVLERYGLGRFRVTQKADLRDASDVYRAENARPEDWVMVGNHDTPPLWRVLERWEQAGTLSAHADYLAWRLYPEPEGREAFARELAADPGALAQAQFADLFASRARNVMVFFADLLGLRETYNEPGTFNERNWTLRVPEDYARDYREKLTRARALNLPRALALALRARGDEARARHGELLAGLERLAAQLQAGGDS